MTATLLVRFAQSCETDPAATAFAFSDRTVTYREFAGLVQGIRGRLAETVSVEERRIAIYATQDVWTYASIFAVLASGRAYVPLNPRAPAERNRSCLDQAGIRTLLCSKTTAAVERWQADLEGALNVAETSLIPPRDRLELIASVSETAMAYLLFTSGSTGLPKGVPIYHRNLNCFLEAFVDRSELGFKADDRFLQMFDLTFDLSVMSFAVPLSIGAACHVVPDEGPGFLSVARTLDRGRISVALMVPSVLSFLERYFDEIHLPMLRRSLFCGEALPVRLARSWRACAPNARVLNVYGPTEATIFCSSYELQGEPVAADEYQGVVSIGRPLPGTSFRVVDEQLGAVPSGQRGELVILGGQVTDQYWENPDKTTAAFVTLSDGAPGYRSGDVVFESDDNFYYCGRTDHQLKVDGYRVEPGEIEHHARSFTGVRDAALVGKVESSGRTVLYLFLLVDGSAVPGQAKECRHFLSQRVPLYMVPHKVITASTFPLNQNGKVDRKALLASVGDGN